MKYVLLGIVILAITFLGCTSGEIDISGAWICDRERSLELIIDPEGEGYSVTLIRIYEHVRENLHTYRIEKSNRNRYILWANPEHSCYFKVTCKSVGLKGFCYDTDRGTVRQALLSRTGPVAGDAIDPGETDGR